MQQPREVPSALLIGIILDVIGDRCYEIEKRMKTEYAPRRRRQDIKLRDRICLEPMYAIVRKYEEWIGVCKRHYFAEYNSFGGIRIHCEAEVTHRLGGTVKGVG